MRQYLIYSSSLHFVFFLFLFLISQNTFSVKKSHSYYIDFIGHSKIITMQEVSDDIAKKIDSGNVQGKSSQQSQKQKTDEIILKKDAPLPKPSMLEDSSKLFSDIQSATDNTGRIQKDNGNPISADFSNFPYPWYIAQVRESLWNAWTQKMPSSGSLKCTVVFSILVNGNIKGLSIEKSSGNRLFDYAAISAVENSVPFPPLPDDFFEDRLIVHVEFKTTE